MVHVQIYIYIARIARVYVPMYIKSKNKNILINKFQINIELDKSSGKTSVGPWSQNWSTNRLGFLHSHKSKTMVTCYASQLCLYNKSISISNSSEIRSENVGTRVSLLPSIWGWLQMVNMLTSINWKWNAYKCQFRTSTKVRQHILSFLRRQLPISGIYTQMLVYKFGRVFANYTQCPQLLNQTRDLKNF